jgi:anaerobic ribonucleoside-triphosphate reductase activating protein
VSDIIAEMLKNPLTDGLTLSGGEPFAQSEDCAEIAEAAKKAGLNVWIYTGYTFEELIGAGDGGARRLLGLADVLADGRFILAERTLEYPWRGSRNQRLIDVRRSLSEGRVAEL